MSCCISISVYSQLCVSSRACTAPALACPSPQVLSQPQCDPVHIGTYTVCLHVDLISAWGVSHYAVHIRTCGLLKARGGETVSLSPPRHLSAEGGEGGKGERKKGRVCGVRGLEFNQRCVKIACGPSSVHAVGGWQRTE